MIAKKLVQIVAVAAALAVCADSADAQRSRARNTNLRDGLWFSGGLGYGSLGCDNCGGEREGGLSADLSVGGTLSQRWLVGVGTSAWSKEDQGARVTVATLDARVRFYPSTTGGFFLTGGIGAGSMRGEFGGLSATETGVGTILGLGWDIRVAKNASVTPYWNGFAMRKNEDVNANVGQAGIAITIH
jgi:hypothetical protein